MSLNPTLSEVPHRVQRLMTTDRYQSEREGLFPSPTSLQWTMRTKRARLVEAGALLKINGRVFVDPLAFDAVLLELGQEDIRSATHV